MSLPIDLTDELDQIKQEHYTPENFAWKILIDDTDKEVLSSQLITFTDTKDSYNDPPSFSFEIYITIFMELIFNIMKINFYTTNMNENDGYLTKDFEYDLSQQNLDDILPLLQHKFNELHILLSISKYEENEENETYIQTLNTNKYCKIIFKQNKHDEQEWKTYSANIDDKEYHMVLSKKYKKKSELKHIYATCSLNNLTYRISFEKLSTSISVKCL